jgi:hypothetical protein
MCYEFKQVRIYPRCLVTFASHLDNVGPSASDEKRVNTIMTEFQRKPLRWSKCVYFSTSLEAWYRSIFKHFPQSGICVLL